MERTYTEVTWSVRCTYRGDTSGYCAREFNHSPTLIEIEDAIKDLKVMLPSSTPLVYSIDKTTKTNTVKKEILADWRDV